jgi:hypothetical protein
MEDVIFSKSIKAGKRIYYLDVKKNRKDELFLTITESKKVVLGDGEGAQVAFEKHKIFLYNEDFDKFMDAMNEAVKVAKGVSALNPSAKVNDDEAAPIDNIKLEIDFNE